MYIDVCDNSLICDDKEPTTYTVCAEITRIVHVHVDANTPDEAKELAINELYNGNYDEKELVQEPVINWAEEQ